MPRSTTIILATVEYTIEPRAKAKIQKYLAAIRTSLKAEGSDSMDIEIRFTELLAKRNVHKDDTVTMQDVEAVISQLGSPSDITGDSSQELRRKKRNQSSRRTIMIIATIIGFLGLVMALMLSYAWYQNRHTQEEKKTRTVQTKTSALEIDLYEGNLTVRANADPTDTSVTIAREVRWATDAPKITEEWRGEKLHISVSGCPSFGLISTPVTCEADYTLSVPQSVMISAKTDGGTIDIKGLKGDVNVAIGSGNINLEDITSSLIMARADSGSIKARGIEVTQFITSVDAGTIDAQFVTIAPNVQARADSGSIKLIVPAGQAYNVKGNSDSGNRKILVDQSPRSPYSIEASTDSGDVTIDQR
jgi:hypothetical protein